MTKAEALSMSKMAGGKYHEALSSSMVGGKHHEAMDMPKMVGGKKAKKSKTSRRKTAKRGRKGGNANGIATIGVLAGLKYVAKNKTLRKTMKNLSSGVKSTGSAVKKTASKVASKMKGLLGKK